MDYSAVARLEKMERERKREREQKERKMRVEVNHGKHLQAHLPHSVPLPTDPPQLPYWLLVTPAPPYVCIITITATSEFDYSAILQAEQLKFNQMYLATHTHLCSHNGTRNLELP